MEVTSGKVKLLAAQLEERDSKLRMAAEFGQMLIKENETLKRRNSDLVREIAEESQEKRQLKSKLASVEQGSKRKLQEAMEHIEGLERENCQLERKLTERRLKRAESWASNSSCLTTGDCTEWKEGEEDALGDDLFSNEIAGESSKIVDLEKRLKATERKYESLQEDLAESMHSEETLRAELNKRDQRISALQKDKATLAARAFTLEEKAERVAELENMITQLTQANQSYRDALEESMHVIQELREAGPIRVAACLSPSSPAGNQEESSCLLDELNQSSFSPEVKSEQGPEVREEDVPQRSDDKLRTRDRRRSSVATKPAEQGNGAMEDDPMYFHFNMMVQTVRINMERILGFGPSLAKNSELSARNLYQRALQENVAFFEYQEFIQNAYTEALEKRFEDAENASQTVQEANKLLRGGFISIEEYDQIVRADRMFRGDHQEEC